ncbi:MAG: serine dehydratase subunit alpha family protein [Candidatus Izemoplasmataceae bacterium]
MDKLLYERYTLILKEELVSATGCTEPIAIAYGAAKAKETLNLIPKSVLVEVSDNIIKNAKSVIVPNTNQLKGIKVAVAAGIIAGKSINNLDVISDVSLKHQSLIKEFSETVPIELKTVHSNHPFDLQITLYHGKETAKVRIANHHTNIVLIEKNGEVLFRKSYVDESLEQPLKTLTIKSIIEFADTTDLTPLIPLLDTQIHNNMNIALEGLKSDYGANIGKVIMKQFGNDIKTKAKALAAAASDARMSGATFPVTIVAGSGNQGLTASIPVIAYAEALKVSKEKLYRALIVSNLVTVHQKRHIGPLSAYCGAVFSGAGSGAGIAYLHDEKFEGIAHTIVNALAIVSGMICDGAKPSCAAKIATSVDAGILAYEMVKEGQEFYGGDGIIAKGVEETINNVARLAKDGMKDTDKEIIKIMTEFI